MKKVLILEDEEVLGKVYKKKLEAAGFEVAWMKSVEETEEYVKNHQADVVLLDHGIQGHEKAGVDLIPYLKDMMPDAKIIMLSNYSHSDLQQRALKEGAHAYLIKINTDPQALVVFIQQLFVGEKFP